MRIKEEVQIFNNNNNKRERNNSYVVMQAEALDRFYAQAGVQGVAREIRFYDFLGLATVGNRSAERGEYANPLESLLQFLMAVK